MLVMRFLCFLLLASITFADEQLGRVLTALKQSPLADNTLVVLWSDHGWHLGEKTKYGKTDLWEESDRVPFMVRVPGMTPTDFKCDGVVNLLDMYPTLVELCGLEDLGPIELELVEGATRLGVGSLLGRHGGRPFWS